MCYNINILRVIYAQSVTATSALRHYSLYDTLPHVNANIPCTFQVKQYTYKVKDALYNKYYL